MDGMYSRIVMNVEQYKTANFLKILLDFKERKKMFL